MTTFTAIHKLLDEAEKEKNEEIEQLKKKIAELEKSKQEVEQKLIKCEQDKSKIESKLEKTKNKYILKKPYNFQPDIIAAARSGDIDSIKYILYEKPAEICHQESENMDSALHEAVWHSKMEVIEFLLQKGCYINIRNRI
ncbi:hypothetical protein TVAG_116430 [Trichomonas vaginalis G3]|uniref:Uncharacterized protein n=1 Tax=Trichomonas vaginalis (strain ATCC PRA-98 / G3) TaxID=412133 RepID=A2G6G6_TRIV3|nr:Ankyrin repeat family [Trichomonas vaginalis G3]EAX87248.1 hypothetical protein TVAG_116430 [Trichomonas vaginalis G3]KAI5508173.1 Ankyrin repeat family [Trichomonas vaginalis G3]|eukprot:XP_001300178.1 hypothetical protein [Trichomonas vaginalis G3]